MLSIKKLRFFLVDRYYTNVVLIFPRHMFEEPKADLSSLSEILHEYFIISIQRIHSKGAFTFALPRSNLVVKLTYRSQTTGSEGVSFRLPQLFFSQHRLKRNTQKLASRLGRQTSKVAKYEKEKASIVCNVDVNSVVVQYYEAVAAPLSFPSLIL